MPTRRQLLATSARVAGLLAAAGLVPPSAHAASARSAFDARALPDVAKALGGSAPVASAAVAINGPDVAEDGAVVPFDLVCTAPGVKRLALLVEKNPVLLAAVFDLADGVEPNLSTRVKMAQSSNVFAVALLADGRTLYAVRDVKVTLGGCGN